MLLKVLGSSVKGFYILFIFILCFIVDSAWGSKGNITNLYSGVKNKSQVGQPLLHLSTFSEKLCHVFENMLIQRVGWAAWETLWGNKFVWRSRSVVFLRCLLSVGRLWLANHKYSKPNTCITYYYVSQGVGEIEGCRRCLQSEPHRRHSAIFGRVWGGMVA